MPAAQLYSSHHSKRTAVRSVLREHYSWAVRGTPRAHSGSPNNPRCTTVRMVSHQRHNCADKLTRNVGLCISARTKRTAVRSGSLGAHGRSGWCTGHARACASGSAVVTRVLPLIVSPHMQSPREFRFKQDRLGVKR